MLVFDDVTLRRGSAVVLDRVSFVVSPGEKIAVVGANGAGKTSLLALVQGHLHVDTGDVSLPPKLNVASVAQETPASSSSALDHVLDGDRRLRDIEAALTCAEQRDEGLRHASLLADYEAAGGYDAKSRAARLLHGLGFSTEEIERPVSSFSGGWRMRLNLAQALMCPSDVLLLDEPTNHLDLDAILWLEDWLRVYPGTLLLVSHDRDFIDTIATRVAHVHGRSVKLYRGNYSQFERQRAEALSVQQAMYEKQ
ncbi:MAG: ABC-F family ATP-binding cassette domain-containing protein, partial [Gammaproteobacteria bacterium]